MSIGPIIDESLDQKFVHVTTSAKARQVLLVKWIVLGFCLTACYKSVLLSNMVNIGFEKTVDTVEDALDSGKPLIVPENTDVPSKIRNARGNVRKLANQMKLANMSFGSSKQFPQWVYDGLVNQVQRSAKRRGCLLSYSQAEPGRELTKPSPRLLAEPCRIGQSDPE